MGFAFLAILRPKTNMAPKKKYPLEKEETSTNHQLLGSMLLFGGLYSFVQKGFLHHVSSLRFGIQHRFSKVMNIKAWAKKRGCKRSSRMNHKLLKIVTVGSL